MTARPIYVFTPIDAPVYNQDTSRPICSPRGHAACDSSLSHGIGRLPDTTNGRRLYIIIIMPYTLVFSVDSATSRFESFLASTYTRYSYNTAIQQDGYRADTTDYLSLRSKTGRGR